MANSAANRRELRDSLHHLPPGSVAERRTNPNQWLEVTVGVRRRQDLPDLSALDNRMPEERRYMSREQLAEQYGSDPAAVERIEKFAADHHLVVSKNETASARIGLAGTVGNVSAAFGVELFDYDHPEFGVFHARTGAVSVPAELGDAITGVFGLNNHRVLQRGRRGGGGRHTVHESAVTATHARTWFIPTELATIYNFPNGADLSEQCIGLLEFGGGVEPQDVAAYFAKIGVPKPDIAIIALDGVNTDPEADPDSTGEVMLDIDVAGAMAPGAKLAVYFSTFDEKGIIDCLSAAINDAANNPSVLSISWGWAENQPFNGPVLWSPAALDHVNHSFLAAAQLGITVCVATGDDGSEAQIQDARAHVSFPATSPYVLAVGGTTLHARKNAQGQIQTTEVVWNDGPGSGTGGGISDYTKVPSWQEGLVPRSINHGHFAGRGIPDVAADGDPRTGYLMRSGGKFQHVGGTSASAPLWAALIARINALLGARVGNFNALLYSKIGPAGVLRDITSGNNDTDGLLGGRFAAKAGWDACTGWGSPDGAKLLGALKK